ncbi:MAG: DNRLRE domain-containing protein [Winogradskyella sp.]|uniref:DNRLRE domain-containing protein n=1 Tax=Winogradskyella sp. TaxID=1883156 RepID=UPI0017BFBB73|nr:DNRLRE domain-containing protein [Winogradskyella sp.]MBT8243796.1 DNRLRE domain-containing protein [Winogradskyella sp.]NNK23404.1 DNRLRE domain-containing protein [Winogradskyella sp.]
MIKKQNHILIVTLFLLLGCGKESKYWSFRPNENTGKDAIISAGNPKENFATSANLHMLSLSVNDSIPNDQRFLLRFGFRTIPENTVIDSAFIYLFALEAGHLGKNNSFVTYEIDEFWITKEVNWENQPSIRQNTRREYEAPKDKNQNYKIDVTDFVNDVLRKKIENHGFLFRLEDEKKSYKGLKFHSSNSKTEKLRPKLEVFYKE